jgi:hypothetical protein
VIASIFIYVWYPFFIVWCSHIINPHNWQNSKHAWKLTQLGSTKGPWIHRICIGDNHSLKLHLSTCPPCIAWKGYWISFYKQWPFWRNWESNPTNVHGLLTTYPPLIRIKTRFTNINVSMHEIKLLTWSCSPNVILKMKKKDQNEKIWRFEVEGFKNDRKGFNSLASLYKPQYFFFWFYPNDLKSWNKVASWNYPSHSIYRLKSDTKCLNSLASLHKPQ